SRTSPANFEKIGERYVLTVICSSRVIEENIRWAWEMIQRRIREELPDVNKVRLNVLTVKKLPQFDFSLVSTRSINLPNSENSLKSFLQLTENIRQENKQAGYQTCQRCKVVSSTVKDGLCNICYLVIKEEIDSLILANLNKQCWITYEEVLEILEQKNLPKVNFNYYDNIKRKLQKQKRQDIWKFINRCHDTAINDEIKGLIIELACMCATTPPQSLTIDDMVKAVGIHLTEMYNSGIVNQAVDYKDIRLKVAKREAKNLRLPISEEAIDYLITYRSYKKLSEVRDIIRKVYRNIYLKDRKRQKIILNDVQSKIF
ncbi:hypothetical protein IJT10_00375, partial [bacterium]|nr:hypothetical protein [bacterium]